MSAIQKDREDEEMSCPTIDWHKCTTDSVSVLVPVGFFYLAADFVLKPFSKNLKIIKVSLSFLVCTDDDGIEGDDDDDDGDDDDDDDDDDD